jgi:hypothetical protein
MKRKIVFKIYLSFILINFVSCNNVEKQIIDSNKVIINAKVLTFKELSSIQATKHNYNSFCYPNNWRNGIEFDREKAFYVFAKINNKLLAGLSENESFQINDMLTENNYSLYGKYLNRWEFIDSVGNVICETDKFDGHKILEIIRIGEIDEVIIGPIPEKPKIMLINIQDSKYYPKNPTPKFELNLLKN